MVMFGHFTLSESLLVCASIVLQVVRSTSTNGYGITLIIQSGPAAFQNALSGLVVTK
jgi:hypothetical protein